MIYVKLGSLSVTDPFLTTFYYVEKLNGILRKKRGEGFEKSYVPLHGGRGGQKLPKLSLLINELPLSEDHVDAGNNLGVAALRTQTIATIICCVLQLYCHVVYLN